MKIRLLSPWRQDEALKKKEEIYLKRLRKYASVEIEEIKGARGEDSEAVRTEGEKLLSRVKERTFLVALGERGRDMDSVGFSRWLNEMALSGRSNITFVIGGAAGLGSNVTGRADMELSLSPMTMQHQLARVVLVEQIYRAFTIIRGEPYHK